MKNNKKNSTFSLTTVTHVTNNRPRVFWDLVKRKEGRGREGQKGK
jgi:hypothetical protein